MHAPNNAKFPLVLELREQTNSDPARQRVSFSRLIAKQPTIADPKAVQEAAEAILVRAAKVDEFIGILTHYEAKAS